MAPLNTDSPAVFESYQINKYLPLLSTGIFGTTVPSKSCCVFTKLCSAGWRWQNVQQSPWRFGSALPTQVFFSGLGHFGFLIIGITAAASLAPGFNSSSSASVISLIMSTIFDETMTSLAPLQPLSTALRWGSKAPLKITAFPKFRALISASAHSACQDKST